MNLETILLSDNIINDINKNIDYLIQIIPEIKYMIGFEHKHPHHHLDVWNHTLLALSMSEKDFDVRLSLLLHDIGKPNSYQEGEIRHFKNHQKISADMSRVILKRFGYNDNYIKYICFLIESHDSPIDDNLINKNYELSLKLYEIQRCDALAHHPDKLEKRKKYLQETEKKLIISKKR